MAERNYGIARWQGLNTADDPAVVAPGQLAEMRNLVARSGALVRRPGLLRLTTVTTPQAWPPYVPPVELPWVVQGDLWFRLEVPAAAVVGDEWTLRIVATNRAGAAATAFADGARVTLTIQGLTSGGTWTGFTYLLLTGGGAPDVTTGWTTGVWEAQVRVTDADARTALRLTVNFDGEARDVAEIELATLAEIEVELPPEGVTPGIPFRVLCVARDAEGEVLPYWSGSRVTLAWDDGEGGSLTVTDQAGTDFDARGWEDGIGEWTAVLGDRGAAENLRLQAMVDGAAVGDDTTAIVERFVGIWPEHAQAFEARTLEIRALTAAVEARTGFDGTGYSLSIEGWDAATETWSAWTGLVTFPGATAPDVTTGWAAGVWSATLRFTDAAGFSRVRIRLLRGAVVALELEGELHPVTSAALTIPAQVAEGVAFPLVLTLFDEDGVRIAGFDGTGLTLTAENEEATEILLVDPETGDAPYLTEDWSAGTRQGTVRFADADDGEALTLRAWFGAVEIGTATAAIGAGAPGTIYGFAAYLPVGVTAGVPFELMLIALDAFQGLVAEYAGAGLALAWSGRDDLTGAETELTVELAEGTALDAGWEDGVWRGQVTLAAAEACEMLRLETYLDGVLRGEAETPCALEFTLTAPTAVTAGNLIRLMVRAVQADGAAATAFAGEDLELEVYRASGGAWSAATGGPNPTVGWLGGWWTGDLAAGDAGQLRVVLQHEGELEAEALITVEATAVPPDLPDPPDEDDGETVHLTLTGPARVWPGTEFNLSARADLGGYTGSGASLTVTPGASPAPAIGTGWVNKVASSEWTWTGRLVGAYPGNTMTARLAWVPEYVPEDADPDDFLRVVTAPVGQLVPVVSMPARLRVGEIFALTITMRGDTAGGPVLATYDGTLFVGRVMQVSADGTNWIPTTQTLLTGPDGMALNLTGWSGGQVRPAAELRPAAAGYQLIRIAFLTYSMQGPWAQAQIVGVEEADLDVAIVAPAELHRYGAAATLRVTVTAGGEPIDGAAGLVRLEIEARAGVEDDWEPYTGLAQSDEETPVSFATGWTANVWEQSALVMDTLGMTAMRLLVYQGATLRGTAEITLREDLAVTIDAPATATAAIPFDLALSVTDHDGGDLPRFDDAAAMTELVFDHGSLDTPAAVLHDDWEEPSWYAAWVAGEWYTHGATIDQDCETYVVTVSSARDDAVLAQAEIAVQTTENALLDAIRERQMAAGRAVWAEGSTHTLEQYRDEANALAPSFLLATYSGGAALPTMLPNTHANAATDLVEMYDAVVAMRVTVKAVALAAVSNWGTATGVDATRAGALAAATATAPADGATSISLYATVAYDETYDVFLASRHAAHGRYDVSGLSTQRGKEVRFFGKATVVTGGFLWYVTDEDIDDTYSNFGLPGLPSAAGVYEQLLATVDAGMAAEAQSGLAGAGSGTTDHSWLPSWPGYAAHAEGGDKHSCRVRQEDCFALIDWEFVYV